MDKGYSNNSFSNYNSESPICKTYSSYISCNAAIHSNDGEFTIDSKKHKSGGHGQDAIVYMNQNKIAYEINIVYNNGVRVRNILDAKNKQFKTGNNHTWFPSDWSISDIRQAGEYADKFTRVKHKSIIEGKHYSVKYRNIIISIIYRNNEVSTIFPNKIQHGGRKND